MELNYAAILVATVAQFIFGAIWYTPIFGKTWGKIHGFDQVPPEKQKEMMKDMWRPLLAQLVFTFVTTFVFALLWSGFPASWNVYGLAFFFWLGFVLPTQVAAVMFGGTKPGWVLTKIGIMAGAGLGCMEIIALVFKWMM
ncbi:MAG: DUF1761 domain-containing protein [Candidatus Doudnabacteria bacterium]|nr:DUF1761 domain-containing protein [Candidatus Doudnabacteria bacterium]